MLEFRVLGPVEALADGRSFALPAGKPRALLALLLLNRNRVVPISELVDALWGDDPPETATKALQVYVSQLRKAIAAERLATKPPGYSLRLEENELDLERFERLVRDGRERLAAGDAAAASELLGRALDLWRGPALAEFTSEAFAREAGGRLEEAHLAALEDRIEADLALGGPGRLVPELEELVDRHPLRERLRGQLMLALYRSGRQAEALDLYRRTRETLVEELGIEPGPELQELERAILRQDAALAPAPGPRVVSEHAVPSAPAPAARPRRRRLLVALAGLALIAAAAATAVALVDRGSSSGARSGDMKAFVAKLENFLVQSHEGRVAVAAAVQGAIDCSLDPNQAVVRLNTVQSNRQSLLQQLAALSVADDEEALQASDRLQRAAQASISADWHYRDWLVGRKRCGPPTRNADLTAARVADAKATRAKVAFLTVFNPLAQRLGRRTWKAGDF